MLENPTDMFDSAEESGPRAVREPVDSVERAERAVAKQTMVGLAPVLPSEPAPVRAREESLVPLPMVKVGPRNESFGPAAPVRRALYNGSKTQVGLAAPSTPQLIKQREFVAEEPDPPTVRKAAPQDGSPALLEGSRWVPERAEAQATKPRYGAPGAACGARHSRTIRTRRAHRRGRHGRRLSLSSNGRSRISSPLRDENLETLPVSRSTRDGDVLREARDRVASTTNTSSVS